VRIIIFSFLILTNCSGLFYYPDHFLYLSPKENKLIFEESHFKSLDGTDLVAWEFPPQLRKEIKSTKNTSKDTGKKKEKNTEKNTSKDTEKYYSVPLKAKKIKGTIVQFHGNAQNMSTHFLYLVWLVEHQYQFLTFDYRGYGQSEGDPDQKGTVEDSEAFLEYAFKKHREKKAGKFIVVGQSLGGAILLRALKSFQEKHKNAVDLVVIDSSFVSYTEIAHQKAVSSWVTWIISPFTGILVSDAYAPKPYLKELCMPLLVVHDRTDPVVDFKNGQELFDLWPCKKELWDFDEGTHAGFLNRNKENQDRFLSFVDAL